MRHGRAELSPCGQTELSPFAFKHKLPVEAKVYYNGDINRRHLKVQNEAEKQIWRSLNFFLILLFFRKYLKRLRPYSMPVYW